MSKKLNKHYYFSVEGETEKWYLDHLKRLINAESESRYNVVIYRKVQTSPLSFAKTVTVTSKIDITHWFDYESSEQVHVERFLRTIDELKKSSSIRGKQITYTMGYSNLTFELWMALHKINCTHVVHRDHYLQFINRAFHENFTEIGTYKEEGNFHRALTKISLNDIKEAIKRAKVIMHGNDENGLSVLQHRGYCYFRDNPSLTIHESVERILDDCGLM